MEVYRRGARGIQGPRFFPKPSQLQGRLRALRDGISSHGRAGNYVSDSPQTTLKVYPSRVKPHGPEEDTGQEAASKHVASTLKVPLFRDVRAPSGP